MNKKALDHSMEFIKSWLSFCYKREDIPGFVVAISHKGKLVFNEAYGYADVEKKIDMTPNHIFRIASHSKTFTATAIMQLQEQNKLRIDDFVADYLPWLKKHTDKRWRKVTIRQLMSHGAGVIRDGLDSDYWQLLRPFPSEEELKREILEYNLVIDNNTKLKYSNFGYSLLGMVIKQLSGVPYNQYVQENIINKLGLKNTGPEFKETLISTMVTGYSNRDVDKKRLPIANSDTHSMSPATGFYSTASDLCSYFTAHFVGTKKLLDDESKKEMQRVQWHAKSYSGQDNQDYGLGLELEYLGKRFTIGHGGGFPGHSTKSIADPKGELVVVVLTNCLKGPATVIAKSIYNIIGYFQENTPTNRPKHDMSHIGGIYMNLWSASSIVVTGDKIVSTYPDLYFVLKNPEVLEYVDDKTLKVVDTNSFSSEGELVRCNIKNGRVDSINYNGATMWPEEEWVKKQRSRSIVEL